MISGLVTSGVIELLQRFRRTHLWIAGDLILDEYLDGGVQRISPEAPVPVVDVSSAYSRLGGAANVANCLTALGARVSLCGVVGADPAGDTLLATCREAGIDTRAIGQSSDWQTVRKLRVLSQNQQLLRMDWERVVPVAEAAAELLLQRLAEGPRPDAIVLSDYAKGFLTPPTIRKLISMGRAHGVPVLVDPKSRDFAIYRGASVITPNLKELEGALGAALASVETPEFLLAARAMMSGAGVDAVVVTLGERGMTVVTAEAEAIACTIPAAAREVFDVTGAGDTVIALLALGLASGADLVTSARLANAAAGVVVGKVGTAVVQLDELVRALAVRTVEKVHSRAALAEQVAWWRMEGKRIVFTNGCFDVLHAGHLSLLRQAAALGDVLLVGLNTDASARRLKGESRPLVPEQERAALVAALDCVDGVVLFDEDTPLALISEVLPQVLVKGGDYRVDQVIGREVVEKAGGRVALASLIPDRSTTAIVDRIRARTQGAAPGRVGRAS